jgi:hypothetical protein
LVIMLVLTIAAALSLEPSAGPPVMEYQPPTMTITNEYVCGPSSGRVRVATQRAGPAKVVGLTYRSRTFTEADLAPVNEGLKPFLFYQGVDVLCIGLHPSQSRSVFLVFRGHDRRVKAQAIAFEVTEQGLKPTTSSFYQFPPFMPGR